jgi:hypothetical protein
VPLCPHPQRAIPFSFVSNNGNVATLLGSVAIEQLAFEQLAARLQCEHKNFARPCAERDATVPTEVMGTGFVVKVSRRRLSS